MRNVSKITIGRFVHLVSEMRSKQKQWAVLFREGKCDTEEYRRISEDGRMLCKEVDAILLDSDVLTAECMANELIQQLGIERGLIRVDDAIKDKIELKDVNDSKYRL